MSNNQRSTRKRMSGLVEAGSRLFAPLHAERGPARLYDDRDKKNDASGDGECPVVEKAEDDQRDPDGCKECIFEPVDIEERHERLVSRLHASPPLDWFQLGPSSARDLIHLEERSSGEVRAVSIGGVRSRRAGSLAPGLTINPVGGPIRRRRERFCS